MMRFVFVIQMFFFLAFGLVAGASYMEAYELRIEREIETKLLMSMPIRALAEIIVPEVGV